MAANTSYCVGPAVLAAILAHAAAAAPAEACGLVLGAESRIDAAVPAVNVAERPERGFEIDPATLLRVHREARGSGRSVVGWYHSHPNGARQPSATDAARAVEDGRLWLIAAAGQVTAWRAAAGGPVHGRFVAVDLVAG
ncbi:MAG: M67 family metallopeptidase [Sphingomonadaceae bacterium]|nr:M67 family metallopeptidase [Sphingomonadaceae bacterium]